MASITGDSGDNTLHGGLFRDTIDGVGGDDTIDGHGSNDTLNGGTGNDTIFGSDGDDTISGGDSDDDSDYADHLYGGDGNDIIRGDDGFDYLNGGWGSDELYGGAGTDVIEFSWEDDAVDGGSGDDTLYGNPMGAVTGGVIPLLEGGTGSDWLAVHYTYDSVSNTFSSEASLWADLLLGLATYRYDDNGSPAAFTTSLSGIENLQGGMRDDTLTGDMNNNVIFGGGGNDTLYGSDGSDTLLGGYGYAHELAVRYPVGTLIGQDGDANLIDGGDGNDHIHSFGANDDISGGEGDDFIWVDDGGNMTIEGGEDTDTLYFHGSTIGSVLGAGSNIAGIEVIRFHDGITNSLYGSDPEYNLDLDLTLDASLEAGLHGGTLTVVTGDGDDHLDASNIADSVNVLLEGGEGDDVFERVASANITGGDVFEGGGGIDTLDLDEYLASWGGPAVPIGGNGTVTGVEIINLHGSLTTAGINFIDLAIPLANTSSTGNLTVNGYGLAQDFIDGSNIANSAVSLFLNGAGGNDQLTGGAGDDMLNGGTGGDGMAGGSGSDTYLVDSVSDNVTEGLLSGTNDGVIASVDFTLGANLEELALSGTADIDGTGNSLANEIAGNSGRNTLSGLGAADHLYGEGGDDNLFGGEGDDTLEGGSESDELDGGIGADIMKGGSGDDFYTVDNVGDVVTELSNQGGSDMIMASVSQILPFNVENLWLLGTDNTHGIGNGLDNMLVGNGGSNALTGLAGIDSLFGFGGADFLLGGAGGDALDGGEGSDTALYTVSAAVSIDLGAQISVGGDAAGDIFTSIENVIGSSFADGIIGDAAANILIGGGGADAMAGGDGNDSFYVDNGSDTAIEAAGAAAGLIDTIFASVNFTSFINVERLYLTGASNLNGTGVNNQNDVMYGNSGNNTLDGLTGADNMSGGLGDDTYLVDSAGDIIVETTGGGVGDRVRSSVSFTLAADDDIEILQTDNANFTGAVNLTGNALAQSVFGNNGVNILDGGIDNLVDTLTGYAGDDTYFVNSASDIIVEGAGGGTGDRVRASVSFSLAADDDIEILQTDNANLNGAINLTGNSVSQSVYANIGSNVLNGGAGSDSLTGYAGADFFLFNTALNTATNRDVITDFSVADDTIRLENAIFTLLASTGAVNSSLFKDVIAGAQDADDVVIYNRNSGNIYYDTNGLTAGGTFLFAEVDNGTLLTAADFVVV